MTDLNSMSLAELKTLRKEVDIAIRNYEDRQRKDALAALEAKAAELGFSLNELTGGGRGRKSSAPKFRNPADAAQTWSGRGRQPEWYKALIKSGTDPDSLLIVKS